MSCCAPGAEAGAELAVRKNSAPDNAELMAAARDLGNGSFQLELGVPDVHCATCINSIEKGLGALEMVTAARVNLSTKRVRVTFDPSKGKVEGLLGAVKNSGHRVMLLDGSEGHEPDKQLSLLLRSLAVSGFAAGNIMLFSVSVWSGADDATRDLFHWISALIAIPAVGYAGQPFFRSAIRALAHGRLNMDVPIALAVLLALLMSIFETARGAQDVYFDAAVGLLFFLLIGRTLDHMMREKARGAIKNLARLAPGNATLITSDGSRQSVAISEIKPGMVLAIAAGQRVPVDGVVMEGVSEADFSLVSGEATPEEIAPQSKLLAGTLLLSGAVSMRAEKAAEDSFLARMVELMAAAENSRAGYRRVADRAAAIYAPMVHLLALGAFVGWGVFTGDWHLATLIAISVLIITCPCALALAVPMVHVVAAGRLFEAGVVMKDGAALERLGEVSHVVFDKTGTLTMGQPAFLGQRMGARAEFEQAGRLARLSDHPFSRAIAAAAPGQSVFSGQISETPGQGIKGQDSNGEWRLGKAQWCNAVQEDQEISDSKTASRIWLSRDTKPVAAFDLHDAPRPDAKLAISALQATGLNVSLLSGDKSGPVAELAAKVGIPSVASDLTPADKVARIQALQAQGHKVLMVGDGINDAPALRGADVSMAPASAADVGRSAADFIFTRDSLKAVPATLELARRARAIVNQNFGLAVLYNFIAVPLAISGQVTPLIAALAMSSSSIIVTVNALKLRFGTPWLAKARRVAKSSKSAAVSPLEPVQ